MAFLAPAVLLSAVASSIAVVLVTWIADRAGGTIGGLLILWALLPLFDAAWWAWVVQVPAWLAYFAILYPLWRWQQGKQSERTVHRQEAQVT